MNILRCGRDVRVPRLDKLLLHLLLIVAVALFTYWEMSDIYQKGSRWFPVMKTSVIYLSVVYLNVYLLAPLFLLRRRWYVVYLLAVVYVVLLVYFIEIRLDDVFYLQYTSKVLLLFGRIEINPLLQVFTSVISYILLMVSSSAIILFREWARQDNHVHDLEKTAMLMEMEQLKKQVNPLFLIRMLDHANELSVLGNRKEASILLLKLGVILRYQLYDSVRKEVLLSSEIQFLTEILSLEQQFRAGFSFTVESDGNIQNHLIPPLLFLPVVEYFMTDNRRFIGLCFKVEDSDLFFECHSPQNTNDEILESGEFAGLCRRLTLLYGTCFSIEKRNEDGVEVIRLFLPQRTQEETQSTQR